MSMLLQQPQRATTTDLSAMECLVLFLARVGSPLTLEDLLKGNENLLTFDLRTHMKGMNCFGETSPDCFMHIAARYNVRATRLEPVYEQHLGRHDSVSNAPEWSAMAYRIGLALWIRAARKASTGVRSMVMISLDFRFPMEENELRHEWVFIEYLRLNRSLEELSKIKVREARSGRICKWDFVTILVKDALLLEVND
ncbi:MAG: hypothetical protein ACAI35_17030 [Candidatus Methylacidiphilales bacterium]